MSKSLLKNSVWYVGITADIEQRLFGYHKVPRKNHWFIYRKALTHHSARNIESKYHEAGCRGSHGGGDDTSVYVYAYVISPQTVE